MTTVAPSKDWNFVACNECRNLQPGEYCLAWERRVGQPVDQRVKLCKHYQAKSAR